MKNHSNLEELDNSIVELVSDHWKENGKPLLLSQLGMHGDGRIAAETSELEGRLSSYLRKRLNEYVSVVQHSRVHAKIGVIPADVAVPGNIDELFDSSSGEKSNTYHFAFLLAFRKPLLGTKRRFISKGVPPHFRDLELNAKVPSAYAEVSRDYIVEPGSDDSVVIQSADRWLADNDLQPSSFLWSAPTGPVEFPRGDLLSQLLRSMTSEDLRRVSLPLDIVFKLRSKRI